MKVETAVIQNGEFRKMLHLMTDNYEEKLAAIVYLHNAVASLEEEAEEAALVALQQAAQEGTALSLSFLEMVRPLMDEEEFAEKMRQKGRAIADLMKSQ